VGAKELGYRTVNARTPESKTYKVRVVTLNYAAGQLVNFHSIGT
jgi:hypothetical protein